MSESYYRDVEMYICRPSVKYMNFHLVNVTQPVGRAAAVKICLCQLVSRNTVNSYI